MASDPDLLDSGDLTAADLAELDKVGEERLPQDGTAAALVESHILEFLTDRRPKAST